MQNPLAKLKPTPFSEVHLNFHSPELSLKCLSTILQVNVRLTSGTKTSLEQWSGAVGQMILHEGVHKRALARELLILLCRFGKKYDAAKEIMNGEEGGRVESEMLVLRERRELSIFLGLDQFVPERDTLLITGTKMKFSFSDLGAIFKVLSGDMSMEQQDIEIFGASSASLGKYRVISLESCNYSCLARYRAKFVPSPPAASTAPNDANTHTSTQAGGDADAGGGPSLRWWEMALPEFICHVIAPLSTTSRPHADE